MSFLAGSSWPQEVDNDASGIKSEFKYCNMYGVEGFPCQNAEVNLHSLTLYIWPHLKESKLQNYSSH